MTPAETPFQDSVASNAFLETLELLEWSSLCEHLSSFSSTTQGRRSCVSLPIPNEIAHSRSLLEETKEIDLLDRILEGGLSFQGVHEIKHTIQLCMKGGIASGEELLALASTLASARRLRRQIDDEEVRPRLTKQVNDLVTLPDLERTLKFGLEDGGHVADRASADLAAYRRKMQMTRKERSDRMNQLIRTYGSLLNDHVIAERKGRPVLAVKSTAAAQVLGLVLDTSASGSTVFIEPQEVIQFGNILTQIEIKVLEEEQRLLAIWSREVEKNIDALERLDRILLQLDLALARARYSRFIGAIPPDLLEGNDCPIVLSKLRHPLLLWYQLQGKGTAVMPISVNIEPDLRVVAITGPNTGGKTVCLKTVGLAALMARVGLFLPCSGSPKIPWFQNVLADIGDDQSIQQSLSTFSSHIKRIQRIFKALDVHEGSSLVLLDEIGAGTDPSEGTALAISLLRTLADKSRLTIATTHFGELKSLKYSDSRFENASVAFDSETLSPTYQLQWGIPGRSNALSIARRLGLPDEVITKAQDFLNRTSELDVNTIIEGLEQQRNRQQAAAENAAALLARTELLHEELLSRWRKDSEETEQRKETERRKLLASIEEGQKEVRSLISQLRDGSADGERVRVVGQRLRRIEFENRAEIKRSDSIEWQPQIGERIRLLALGKAGVVLDISEDGLQVTVRCGVLRSKVNLQSVESLDGRKPKKTSTNVEVNVPLAKNKTHNVRTSVNTVDVRGLRVHEAEIVVEDFLRNVSGTIWIVHGIGTGKLKKGLRKWLESLPYVERVSDAAQQDGGGGCSVVCLK